MTTRRIAAHKGGRTARAPEARMTPQERGRLDTVLQRRGVKHTDWYIGHVNEDYEQIIGGNEMFSKSTIVTDAMLENDKTRGELARWIASEVTGDKAEKFDDDLIESIESFIYNGSIGKSDFQPTLGKLAEEYKDM